MSGDSTPFEFAMGLFSVVIGLAVADVATSFHRLMRLRESVRWDGLTLIAAAYALCVAVYMWFDLWGVRHFAATRHFPFYLALVLEFFVLFLAAAASLPDEANEKTDLRTYYERNRRYFWTLLTLFQVGYTLFGFYFVAGELPKFPFGTRILLLGFMASPALVSAGLIFLKSRSAHYLGVGLLFVLMTMHYAAAQIG